MYKRVQFYDFNRFWFFTVPVCAFTAEKYPSAYGYNCAFEGLGNMFIHTH